MRILKYIRKLYLIFSGTRQPSGRNNKISFNKAYANDLIYKILINPNPVMIARLGSNELNIMQTSIGVKSKINLSYIINYIRGRKPNYKFSKKDKYLIKYNAGFFPTNEPMLIRYSELMIDSLKYLDILGSWRIEENMFYKEMLNSKKVMLEDLEPFFCSNPWTKALDGKKVLVIHPFDKEIKEQYNKRNLIFEDNILPDFELFTLKAIQTAAGNHKTCCFNSWFEVMEHYKSELTKIDFDIAILGCGSYGFPLAAHIKKIGKKAIHLGGVTQLLFGIIGKRWEKEVYKYYPYSNLFNEHWIRPYKSSKPKHSDELEKSCYW